MNSVVADLRASRNCSSTIFLQVCTFCFLETARATAGEPVHLEERGFHHCNRLNELYNTETTSSIQLSIFQRKTGKTLL